MSRRAATVRSRSSDEPHALDPCGRRPSDAELIAAIRESRRASHPLPSPSSKAPVERTRQTPYEWYLSRRLDEVLIETVRNSHLSNKSFTPSSRLRGRMQCRTGDVVSTHCSGGARNEPSVSSPEFDKEETYGR